MLLNMSLLQNFLKFATRTAEDFKNRRPTKLFVVDTGICTDQRQNSLSTTSLLMAPLSAYFPLSPLGKGTQIASKHVAMRRTRTAFFSCTNSMLSTNATSHKPDSSLTPDFQLRTQSAINRYASRGSSSGAVNGAYNFGGVLPTHILTDLVEHVVEV